LLSFATVILVLQKGLKMVSGLIAASTESFGSQLILKTVLWLVCPDANLFHSQLGKVSNTMEG
jgi:hypothetical protein